MTAGLPALSVEASLAVRVALVAGYLAILVIDLRTRRIPNLITYPLLLVSLLARPEGVGPAPPANILAAAVAFVLFALFVSRGWMGMGDAKLAALIALASGPAPAAIALWGAFVSAGVAGALLLVTRRVGRRDAIPFGPFLALAGVAAALASQQLLERSPFGPLIV